MRELNLIELSVDEIEDIQTDSLAVDLRENVADFVHSQISIQLDVRDLIIIGYAFEMTSKFICIPNAPFSLLNLGL